ncbi:DUF4394 domain-containing protein [Actinophytocola gossypii]|uniref:DUF4394 domain-containing protein n=1 Tax=Actinophytocola gossypii TaxID=2812003 RepID=A0ABT2J2T2_9PSEU|nr:DUF4394 domain-containing protein [Actinophytocola gossypii]MCT2582165.1 DUF4394 domain-containing protein [Actinophytocola gossypii]
MKARTRRWLAAAAATVAASTAVLLGNTGGATAAAPSLPVFGLIGDGTTMCAFSSTAPGTLNWVKDVQGFAGNDTRLVGIDFRPKNGLLYAVANHGGIYTIPVVDPDDPYVALHKVGQLSVALNGTSFGVDFNPAVDRLRIISDHGQNLRHDVDGNHTIKDMPLTVNGAPATGVTAAAYTNNDASAATGTTLFDIDTRNDQVAIQAPANNGTLNPTGAVGLDAGLAAGADIFSDVANGRTVANTAFATLLPAGGRQSFYTVDVLTGAATLVGTFPSIAPVTDVAVTLDTN